MSSSAAPQLGPDAATPLHPSRFRSLEDIYRDIYENRQFNLNYFLMLVMACLIALLGLLENSPAVIIGAMLISPLMGPILSCGLALTSADWLLSQKALRNVGFSVLETIAIAALATWLVPLRAVTPEILARTNPNLMDLLIAIFSGVAGTLALCSKQGGLTIIPGVAIAVAVMPPLATVGYGISTHQWTVARGAFLLFFTNLMAIIISANLVFFAVGFRARREPYGPGRHLLFRYRVLIAWSLLVVLSVPLMQTLIRAAQQVSLRNDVVGGLRESLNQKGKAILATVDLQQSRKVLSVDAVVRTPVFIKGEEVKEMETALTARLGRAVQLRLEQVQLAKNEPASPPPKPATHDYLAAGVVHPLTPEPEELPGAVLAHLQDRIQTMLVPLMAPMRVDSLAIESLSRENDVIAIQVTGQEQAPTDIGSWNVAAAALEDRISSPVRITGKIFVSGSTFMMQFHPHSIWPVAKDLHKAKTLAKSWGDRSDLSFELTASSAAKPELSRRRVALLSRELNSKIAEVLPADSSFTPEQIKLAAVQVLNVSGAAPLAHK